MLCRQTGRGGHQTDEVRNRFSNTERDIPEQLDPHNSATNDVTFVSGVHSLGT